MDYYKKKRIICITGALICFSISMLFVVIICISLLSGLYSKGTEYAWEKYLNDKCYSDAFNTYNTYCNDYFWNRDYGTFNSNYYDNIYDERKTNFRFICTSDNKTVIPGYYNSNERAQYTTTFKFKNDFISDISESTYYFANLSDVEKSEAIIKARERGDSVSINPDTDGRGYNVIVTTSVEEEEYIEMKVYIPEKLTAVDEYFIIKELLTRIYYFKVPIVIFALAAFAGGILFFCTAVSVEGKVYRLGGYKGSRFMKLPFDLYSVIVLGMEFALVNIIIYCMKKLYYYRIESVIYGSEFFFLLVSSSVLLVYFGIKYFLSTAARARIGGIGDNLFIMCIFEHLANGCIKIKNAVSGIGGFFGTFLIFLIPDAALLLLVILGIGKWYGAYGLMIIGIVLVFVVFFLQLMIMYNIWLLEKSLGTIADGKLEYKITMKNFLRPFRKTVESVNHISDGMSIALKEKIKSEHFKTELITNVSHDIKTPLTSIMNYVGLLQQSEIKGDEAEEYLEVLERQSGKLKKLIEDLIEASKASTGNIEMNMQEIEIGTLVSQALAEYYEKFESRDLKVKTSGCESGITVMADGRYLWRVFDNLLVNIYKYALDNTRVYVMVEKDGDICRIIFKNISKYEISVTAQELMERFVRGDKSRNTEGSGLGLSIARNLTEAMNGKLYIDMDGDLYKAVIELRINS